MKADSIENTWTKICENDNGGVGFPIFLGADAARPVARLSNTGTLERPLPCIYVRLETKKPEGLKNETYRGFSVQVEKGVFGADDKTQTYVLITCADSPYVDLFLNFSQRLLVKLEAAVPPSEAVKQMIQEWTQFFKRAGLQPLTLEEITGLFGELTLLKYLVGKFGASKKILSAWHGPKGAIWDFSLADVVSQKLLVEVKTTIRPRTIISVNGIDQLAERVGYECWLNFISVEYLENSGSKTENTILELIAGLKTSFGQSSDGNIAAEFEEYLELAGYFKIHEDEYIKHTFRQNSVKWHQVDNDFPSISRKRIPAEIRNRIEKLNYRLNIAGLKPFEAPV